MITNYMSMAIAQMEKEAAIKWGAGKKAIEALTGGAALPGKLRSASEAALLRHPAPAVAVEQAFAGAPAAIEHAGPSAQFESYNGPGRPAAHAPSEAAPLDAAGAPDVHGPSVSYGPNGDYGPSASVGDSGGWLAALKSRGQRTMDYVKESPWRAAGVMGTVGGAGLIGHHQGYESGAEDVGPAAWRQGLYAGGAASRKAADQAGFFSRLFGNGGQGEAQNLMSQLAGPKMTSYVVDHILSQS